METTQLYEVGNNGNNKPATLSALFNGMMQSFGQFAHAADQQLGVTAKQDYVSSLGLPALFAEMHKANDALYWALKQKRTIQADIKTLQRQMEEIKALKIVNGEIVGKNEAERNAAMTVALRDDAEYCDLHHGLTAKEDELMQLDLDIDQAHRQASAIRHEIEAGVAQLQFLRD